MNRGESGQGLVEFAFVAVLLLALLVGMAEVAYALRAHHELVNHSREIARYAARGVEETNVTAYAETLLPEGEYAARLVYFKVNDDLTTVSTLTETLGLDFDFGEPDPGPFLDNQGAIWDIYHGGSPEVGPQDMLDFQVVIADVMVLHHPLTGFFGVAPMRLKSRAVFRVTPGRGME